MNKFLSNIFISMNSSRVHWMLSMIIFMTASSGIAQEDDFGFVAGMGGVGDEYGHDIVVDSSGNIYTTGYFNDIADFDPGKTTVELTSMGSEDIFIQKLDSDGNLLWAVGIGGPGRDVGQAISVDVNSNVYITGYFADTVDFNPGPGTFNLTSVSRVSRYRTDVFILKLDSDGNFLWAKEIGSTEIDQGQDIALDESSNVYIVGHYQSTVDFDPDPESEEVFFGGDTSVFVLKLDLDGNFVWASTVVDDGQAGNLLRSKGIAVDTIGNVYSIGWFRGTIDFDPGSEVLEMTSLEDHAFLQKLDSDGNLVWLRTLGDTNSAHGDNVTLDTSGNVYTVGYFWARAIDFDPGEGTVLLSATLGTDIYVQKLDSNGDYVWATAIGRAPALGSPDYGIAVDAFQNVYISGAYNRTMDFDPGEDVFELTSNGIVDIFVQKLDAHGNFLSVNSFGGTGFDAGTEIALDNSNTAYITGYFESTVSIELGSNEFNLESSGGLDTFVLKLKDSSSSSSSSSSSEGPCFIATAAFGTPLANEINTLRNFRDDYLLNSTIGAAFVDAYYRTSPTLARHVAKHPFLAQIVRTILMPVIAILNLFYGATSLQLLSLLIVLGFSAVHASRLRKQKDSRVLR